MAFQTFQKPQYPTRQWLIEGEAGAGKSTFITQLRTPMLTVDADQRFSEVFDKVQGPVFQLSNDPLDNTDPDRIAALVTENIRGSGVKNIVIDSLTAIIAPLVTRAFRQNQNGNGGNKVARFAEKATAMRLLQDVITGTGCDVAWIYHIYEGRDARAQQVERTSISELELSRVLRSCNMRIRISHENGVYKATVVWARSGRSGIELVDDSGTWAGMPEKIEAAVYDGLSEAEQRRIESRPPEMFPSPDVAIRWGMDQAVFRDEAHAQNAYNLVRRAKSPQDAIQMRNYWVAEVEARQAGHTTVP
jgi:hypothetical protein